MKFEVLGEALWVGIKQVLDITRSVVGSSEVALEAIDHDIFIYRNNFSCNATYRLPAYVKEPGKVIVGDVTPLQFHEQTLTFAHKEGQSRVSIKDDNLATKLVVSSTDPDNFSIVRAEGQFYSLPKLAKRVLWVYTSLDMPIYISDNTVMARDGGILFSWFKGDRTITPEACVMLAETINLISDDVMIQVTEDAIWIKTANLTAKLSYQFSTWDGNTLLDRILETRTGAWFKASKNELHSAAQYTLALSRNENFTNGLMFVELLDGQVTFSTAAEGVGAGNRVIQPAENEGAFKMKLVPQQIVSALAAADTDEILIEAGGISLLITGDKIISSISMIPSA